MGQYLWHNELIKVANQPFIMQTFFETKLCFVNQLYNGNQIKTWNEIKAEFGFDDRFHFQYMQLIDAIPTIWKRNLSETEVFASFSQISHVQGLLHCTRLVPIDKLVSK